MQLTESSREQGRLKPEIHPRCGLTYFFSFPSPNAKLYSEALLPVSCLKAASFRGFGGDITRSSLCPSSQTHRHIPYPHLMIIFFSCCKTGWLASQREQLPLALGVSWPLAMFTGRCAPRKRNQLPPSSGPISSH